ncbi:hypothetical protein NYR54_05095 [Chelativorans sp. SCAU2101]|jgi:hypothetical protein|uniref:Phage holin family protein n=1 Tax=Chelativorans petroleitrophicus TaxID=2975484 RepID=A0A9X2X6R6_9HYPH|nr:hypothetical protein [Chelativorans petroleitrophicus]MCT8989673.1 hypothetical protein [Chelativorans petroleitrophicus]
MLGRLIALLATGEAAGLKQRVKSAAIAYGIIAVATFLALAFLLLAAYLAAATRWGAIAAALWFGTGFLVLAAIAFAIYRLIANAQRRARRRQRVDTGLVAGASAITLLPTVLGKKTGRIGLLLVLAGIAGFAAYREVTRSTGKGSRATE